MSVFDIKNKFDFNVLFLGGIIPKSLEKTVLSNSNKGYQYAANEFQWSLIKGFDAMLSKPCTLINRMFIGSYPINYKKAVIKSSKFSHIGDINNNKDINLGFINISIIKQLIRPFSESRAIRHWINSNNDRPRMVFIYSFGINTYYLSKLVKRIDKDCIVFVSVNDLPQYTMMTKKQTIFKKIWMKHVQKLTLRSVDYIDGFMLVSKHIADIIQVSHKPYVVVEGLVDLDSYQSSNIEKPKTSYSNLSIVYTGGINKKYGVKELLDAFSYIRRDDINLLLCGDGDMVEIVMDYAKKDKRIQYLGVMSHEKIVEIQESASILVNPRKNVSDFTKYSFPIKTVEYLIAGCPVIGYKLEGIPEEYFDYIITPADDTVESLSDTIEKILNMSEDDLIRIGERNRSFIIHKKNKYVQVEKIMSLANRISNGGK